MLRKILPFLPLIFPFLAYAIYMVIASMRTAGGPKWEDTPWVWLSIIGMVLFIATLIGFALLTGDDIAGTFISPRLENGKIIPAEVQ
jgi:hypothetical protein